MSVVGEYQRILGDFRSALADAESEPAAELATRLADADVEVAGDVSEAARRTLDLLGDVAPGGMTGFPSEREQKLFDEALEHLRSVCRVILGRS